jgi:hypothetical protein
MRDGRVYLKVKAKSLAAEAKIIRKEEKRNPSFRQSLAEHRRTVVRKEARHTLLAYGFLKGRRYRQIEKKAHEAPDWSRVEKMLDKYGALWVVDESGSSYLARKEKLMKDFSVWKDEE